MSERRKRARPLARKPYPTLPGNAVATIVVYPTGVEVNLAKAMPVPEFVALLRKIADSYEGKTIKMTFPDPGVSSYE